MVLSQPTSSQQFGVSVHVAVAHFVSFPIACRCFGNERKNAASGLGGSGSNVVDDRRSLLADSCCSTKVPTSDIRTDLDDYWFGFFRFTCSYGVGNGLIAAS